jgi:hypothetical protein
VRGPRTDRMRRHPGQVCPAGTVLDRDQRVAPTVSTCMLCAAAHNILMLSSWLCAVRRRERVCWPALAGVSGWLAVAVAAHNQRSCRKARSRSPGWNRVSVGAGVGQSLSYCFCGGEVGFEVLVPDGRAGMSGPHGDDSQIRTRLRKRPNEPGVVAPCPRTQAAGAAPQMLIDGRERSLQRHSLT